VNVPGRPGVDAGWRWWVSVGAAAADVHRRAATRPPIWRWPVC